jgi:hypothetical protein
LSTATAAADATATAVELTVIHCQERKRQQHHQQQLTNGSTIVRMFTSPDNYYLTYLQNLKSVMFVERI